MQNLFAQIRTFSVGLCMRMIIRFCRPTRSRAPMSSRRFPSHTSNPLYLSLATIQVHLYPLMCRDYLSYSYIVGPADFERASDPGVLRGRLREPYILNLYDVGHCSQPLPRCRSLSDFLRMKRLQKGISRCGALSEASGQRV